MSKWIDAEKRVPKTEDAVVIYAASGLWLGFYDVKHRISRGKWYRLIDDQLEKVREVKKVYKWAKIPKLPDPELK